MLQTVACCLGCHTDPPLPWLLMASQDAAGRVQRKTASVTASVGVDFSSAERRQLLYLYQKQMADTRSPSMARKRPAEDSYPASGRWQPSFAPARLPEVLRTALTLPRHYVRAGSTITRQDYRACRLQDLCPQTKGRRHRQHPNLGQGAACSSRAGQLLCRRMMRAGCLPARHSQSVLPACACSRPLAQLTSGPSKRKTLTAST